MKKVFLYITLTAGAMIMLYPLLWLIGGSFKSNEEIFSSVWFMPERFDFSVYVNAWKTVTPFFALVSSVLTAYGFARFDFPGRKFFFAMLMGAMFMPAIVTIMPLYLMWGSIGALDSYVPLTVPSLFAVEGTFVFMLIQFFRGVPREFDEAARIDGCNTLQALFYVIIPCTRPVLVSISVFTFLWTMNDFLTPLIMISSVEKYPLSLLLRLSADSTGDGYELCKLLAMSVLGLLPSITVFAFAQKKFVGGITAGGLSG